MKILVINGANMNLLGKREPDIYGREDYAALCARIYAHAQSRGIAVECFQSNHEGAIIDAIQEADADVRRHRHQPRRLRALQLRHPRRASRPSPSPSSRSTSPTLKSARSSATCSVTAPACIAQIRGHGFESYTMAHRPARGRKAVKARSEEPFSAGGRLPFCQAVFRNFSKYCLTFRRDGATLYLEIFLNTMKGVSDVGLSETMKALGDPVRREILNLLKGGRMTAGDIASRFDMTAATVSYHLAQLKKAGLIFESREKNFIYYSLNASVLEEVLLWLQDLKGEKEP